MNYSSTQSFSDLIANNRLLEGVLERMNFPKSSWRKPLQEVCKGNAYSADLTIAILKAFDEHENFPTEVLLTYPIASILQYLRATHKYYLEKKLPEIEQTFLSLIADYRSTHPDLVRLSSLFIDYKAELTHHIEDEENNLFPYIDWLIRADYNNCFIIPTRFREYSLRYFEESHENVEKSLGNLQRLISGYAPKYSAALPFRVFLLQMDFFEKDLNRHGLMEDDVLMTQALLLERRVRGN